MADPHDQVLDGDILSVTPGTLPRVLECILRLYEDDAGINMDEDDAKLDTFGKAEFVLFADR